MAKANPNIPRIHPDPRNIDPDVARDARQSGVPDINLYDTSAVDRTGPSNWYLLVAVLIVVGVLLAVLRVFY